MSTEPAKPPVGMLGLLVLGRGIGFTTVMAGRSGTVNDLFASVQADVHLVGVSLFEMALGAVVALYGRWD